jgi:signal transduction histidine kinase/DNA-binding response OmpR family regulator
MRKIFGSLRISNKLASVFLVLLFMMGVGGSVGLYNALQLAKVTERLYTDSIKRGETLSSVENEFLSARQEVFLHAIVNDEASMSYLEGTVDEHRNKIERLLREYPRKGRGSAQEALFGELKTRLDEYWAVHRSIEALSRAGERDTALTLISMEGTQSFIKAVNALKRLIKEERASAYAYFQKSKFFADLIISVTLALTLLAIASAAGFWLALTRAIVRPILTIEDTAKRVREGDLKQRVAVASEDEIGSLATEFNRMADSLENYYATLEKKVEERTEQLRHANEELFRKKQELEYANIGLQEANSMKSQFLANVSHELRTPLNSIIGFSELLRERAFGELNEKQLQYVDFVYSSGGHLLQLINNILDLSKIEAGRMELVAEDFPIMEALGETLGIIRPLAHKRNVAIEAKAVPASPMIRADKAKFKQIMLNLLSNAVKFNVEGGRVDVAWECSEEPRGMKMERFITLSVRDTGIGIKDEDKSKLFKEFEQIDSSITREYGGTGLGLALTRRLVELHGGEIWVESEPGVGSVFRVKLPRGTDAIDVPSLSGDSGHASGLDARPLVVVAGESADEGRLLEVYLAGGGYRTALASDGIDLLRKAGALKPFSIVMGTALPKKDGWDALKELKANPLTADIPVVIISSMDDVPLGYGLGAAEYIEKPLKRERLLSALGALGSREAASRKTGRVLFIDEDQDALEDTAEVIENAGFTVFMADSSAQAISIADDTSPDVIVLRMKGRSSLDPGLVERLLGLTEARDTPIIVFADGAGAADGEGRPQSPRVTIRPAEGAGGSDVLEEIRRAIAAG